MPVERVDRLSERDDVRQDREKVKAVDLAFQQIEKQFGKGSIMRLGQKGAIQQIEAIPTGAISIDYALGIGGVPRGRVIEIFGPESSGKTTLALQVIAEAQKRGGMKEMGFKDLTLAQIVRMRDHGITPGFINHARSRGYQTTDPDEIIRLKNVGLWRD